MSYWDQYSFEIRLKNIMKGVYPKAKNNPKHHFGRPFLSSRIKSGKIKDIEGVFLSCDNIEEVRFFGGVIAATVDGGYDLSMFRIKEDIN